MFKFSSPINLQKMKKFVFAFLLGSSFSLSAQSTEFYLNKTITVGCYNANPLTDMSKKVVVDIKDNTATFSISSISCKKEFNGTFVGDFGQANTKAYYDQKEERGIIVENNEKAALFAKKDGKYAVIVVGHTDKKLAKSLSIDTEDSKYKDAMNNIENTLKAAKENAKKEAEKAEAAEKEAEKAEAMNKRVAEMGDMYKKNIGKVLFTASDYKKCETSNDIASEFVTEFYLGKDKYFNARAYFEAGASKGNFDVRYTIGDVSLSVEQVRIEMGKERGSRYAGGVAGAGYHGCELAAFIAFYGSPHYRSYPGPSYGMTEDAFKIFLSRVGAAKLTPGSVHTLKVEILEIAEGSSLFTVGTKLIASGEVKMKVGVESTNDFTELCSCKGKSQKVDADIEKEAKALLMSFNDVKSVHSVTIVDRDYTVKTTNSGAILNREIYTDIYYITNDGTHWIWSGNLTFQYEGSGFSKTAKLGTGYVRPVSPTCLR
jgi:hypothetical protein